ncbi:MAG: signal peptide peptidase SppA [Deltaproteobacteria bacterium]|nr:signal peptide peptidase SppA [Deltaproteobacteria bacterium]
MKKRSVVIFIILAGIALFGLFLLFILAAAFSGGGLPAFRGHEPVAIVEITGPIFESKEILKDLKEYQDSSVVQAVVLRLDSPGGAVGPSQEIYEQVLELKKHKKVVASMGAVAASGAYYIACASDHIVANPGTITGSIGVIMEMFGLKELAKTLKIEPRVIKSGKFKNTGSPFKELTERDRQYLQHLTDDMYEQFVEAVAVNRNIPIAEMHHLAEGRVYTGRQALELKLVDELGNYYKAISAAKKLAGLPESTKVLWPKEPTAFEEFFGNQKSELTHLIVERFLLSHSLPGWKMKNLSKARY